MRRLLLMAVFLLAGCYAVPFTPQDIQARKFEAVPGKAVIYVVRAYPDHSDIQAPINVGDKLRVNTYPGTYYRWEAEPGKHRIAGAFFDNGAIEIATEPGRIYFVLQRVTMMLMGESPLSSFQLVSEPAGRAAVMRSVMVSPGA